MFSTKKKTYIVLFGDNKFEGLQLILYGLIRRVKILIITSLASLSCIAILKRVFFINRYVKKSIEEYEAALGRYKGLWYELHRETGDLTSKFYSQQIKGKCKLIVYYNKLLDTIKFEAYIKKVVSVQILSLLKELHHIRLSHLKDKEILIIKSPINEFVVKYMEDRYGLTCRTRWIYPVGRSLLLFTYYGWLFVECIKRGVVLNKKKKNYKISKEAVWGFYQKTLRDDIIIDNSKFKKNEMLILEFSKGGQRARAFSEAKKRDFDAASVPKLKININKNIFSILFFYFWVPIKAYFQLILSTQLYLFYYIVMFHKRAFPIEILMNLYRIKCNISTNDWGDVAETIILNKYKGRNIIFHWFDLTVYRESSWNFIAHNIYFVWGDIHCDFLSTNRLVDKKVNIGCIFKREYNKAVENKGRIINQIFNFKNRKKIVTFFDNSFSNASRFTKEFFLEYFGIIKEFCNRNKDISVLLKPKTEQRYALKQLQDNLEQYKKIWKGLTSCDNFNYLDPLKWSVGETIAISEVCISMGMASPSTIALICGNNALYFDQTGNVYHPFAKKYKNIIAFEDKELLFKQITNILNGRFNCRDVISEREIREYDTFSDDNALERLRDNLYELTKE